MFAAAAPNVAGVGPDFVDGFYYVYQFAVAMSNTGAVFDVNLADHRLRLTFVIQVVENVQATCESGNDCGVGEGGSVSLVSGLDSGVSCGLGGVLLRLLFGAACIVGFEEWGGVGFGFFDCGESHVVGASRAVP